jgi:hypothetical protein
MGFKTVVQLMYGNGLWFDVFLKAEILFIESKKKKITAVFI